MTYEIYQQELRHLKNKINYLNNEIEITKAMPVFEDTTKHLSMLEMELIFEINNKNDLIMLYC